MVLTGFAADICVLFTANDAYMHGYDIIIPSDAVAANSRTDADAALAHLRNIIKASTPRTSEIDFAALKRRVDATTER